jgi:cellulose synthase/poly-beta-1,6-N-acetylglucosamine synthase-like glycosyltransferase
MIVILVFSVGISLAYIFLISRYISGWNKLPEFTLDKSTDSLKVTVIIAFRNEEQNLPVLFDALNKQSYSHSCTEIIFVDDHSEDHSASLVQKFALSRKNIRMVSIETSEAGKKKALALAAIEAKGKLLIFTDADTLPHNNWIKAIVSCYLEKKPVLIAAPVLVKSTGGFFSRFQSLEFYSLMASTAGAFGLNDPIMVNGANLAVEREVYLKSIDNLQYHTSSGDDVFLLLDLKKKYPERLFFLKSREAAVSIEAHESFLAFITQRLRWTSKSRYYKDKAMIFTALLVLLINVWLLTCFIMAFFNVSYIFIGGGVLLVKSFIDFIILRKILRYFGEESLLRIFVLSQFLYFLYISFTGIAGNFMPNKWKGRAIK